MKIVMKTFVINHTNCAKVYDSREGAPKNRNGAGFGTQNELAAVSADWPMLRLVAIWNQLPSVKPVRKFRDRSTALRRIWSAIQTLMPSAGTKSDLVIGLLKRASGATLTEIMIATGSRCRHPRRSGAVGNKR